MTLWKNERLNDGNLIVANISYTTSRVSELETYNEKMRYLGFGVQFDIHIPIAIFFMNIGGSGRKHDEYSPTLSSYNSQLRAANRSSSLPGRTCLPLSETFANVAAVSHRRLCVSRSCLRNVRGSRPTPSTHYVQLTEQHYRQIDYKSALNVSKNGLSVRSRFQVQ